MPNTITITKLINGNVLVDNDSVLNTFNPDCQCFKTTTGVELKDKSGSRLTVFEVEDVEKVVRDDGTNVTISDVDTLFSELINFFFFKSVGSGGNSPNLHHLGEFANYTDLITQYPTPPDGIVGTLAYVLDSQGISWLPGSYGGTFYSKGTYAWTGTIWDSAVDDIAKAIEDLNTEVAAMGISEVLAKGQDIDIGKKITSTTGKGSIDMNAGGVDGDFEFLSDKVKLQMLASGTLATTLGVFPLDPYFSQIVETPSSFVLSVVKSDFTRFGQITLAENTTGDVLSGFLPNYPAIIAAENSKVLQGVINSTISGGIGIIGKTNNTNYSTQIGYSKNNEPFELIVDHATPTADRTQTHQDKDGDIALTKNIAISQAYIIQTIITAPTITSNQDNYSPVGFDDDTDLIRVDVDANNRSISGIPAPPLGVFRILGIKNTNTTSLDLRFEHNNAGSLPQNRFLCRDNTRKSIKPNEMALWFYDHNVQRWTPFNRIG
jgi:hypothetical protein